MRTEKEVAEQILKAQGIPIEQKVPNKAYHDREVTTKILRTWKGELLSQEKVNRMLGLNKKDLPITIRLPKPEELEVSYPESYFSTYC